MEDLNIIWIILWIVAIIGSQVFSSKKKKKEAQNAMQSAIDERFEHLQPRQPRQASMSPMLKPAAPPKRRPVPKAQQKPAAAPSPALPEEGKRVTATVKQTPPMAPTKKKESWLSDRDNLRRAIVLGEVLAPKF